MSHSFLQGQHSDRCDFVVRVAAQILGQEFNSASFLPEVSAVAVGDSAAAAGDSAAAVAEKALAFAAAAGIAAEAAGNVAAAAGNAAGRK